MRGIFTRSAVALALLGLLAAPVGAQSPVQTLPTPQPTISNASSTIAVTDTFQSVFGSSVGRKGCTVQNNGSNTMWVYFGAIAGATKGKSVVLSAGLAVSCQVFGIVLTDQVSITGTSGDAFFAALQ